ncbi:hypothetical protein SKAU_G00129310 [Synaphobranchus kaupii]|uniref:Uncharacterized protein n=1 Tax=Synaphobranchus kaupii TaxID=118154 RepID=A0A9Q1J3A4_SYNKA|nr:hypothetical protein SKAU_G00129310 [Synaphobranchus kaupii]
MKVEYVQPNRALAYHGELEHYDGGGSVSTCSSWCAASLRSGPEPRPFLRDQPLHREFGLRAKQRDSGIQLRRRELGLGAKQRDSSISSMGLHK